MRAWGTYTAREKCRFLCYDFWQEESVSWICPIP
jgi:hypothetical protein